MSYLKKLKDFKKQKTGNKPIQRTVKTAKSTYDSFGSTTSSRFSGNLKLKKIIGTEILLQNQIDELWNKATILADWIDNPTSEITWQERTKHVPTVLEMGREIDLLVDRQQDVTEKKPLPKSRPVVLNPIPVETKPAQPETCPAKCKRSGKCYGNSWFTGKAGKSSVCVPVCPWAEQLKQHYIDKKVNSL